MPRRFRAAPIAAIALMLIVLLAAIGCGNAGTTGITYEFKAGDSFSYVMQIDMSGTVSGPDMAEEQIPEGTSVEARFTLEVTDVKDGIATVVYRNDSLEMTAEGQTESLSADMIPDVTMQIDSEGRIVSVDGGTAGMPFGMGMSDLPFDPSQFGAQMTVVTPEGGLGEVGDDWTATSTMPIPGTGQEVTTTLKATLVGLDTVDGQTIATIDYALDIPLDIEIDLAEMMKGMGLEQMMEEMGDDLAFKMVMTGHETMTGATKINMSKGVPLSFVGDVSMKLEFAITEAPEDMIPAEERGPFGMDMELKITLDQVQ